MGYGKGSNAERLTKGSYSFGTLSGLLACEEGEYNLNSPIEARPLEIRKLYCAILWRSVLDLATYHPKSKEHREAWLFFFDPIPISYPEQITFEKICALLGFDLGNFRQSLDDMLPVIRNRKKGRYRMLEENN